MFLYLITKYHYLNHCPNHSKNVMFKVTIFLLNILILNHKQNNLLIRCIL